MNSNSPVSRSGRFESGPSEEVATYGESISFDHRLWEYDIMGSIAHASMLKKIGILTSSELNAIKEGLSEIGCEIADGKFQWNPNLEDVHMNIEAELTKRVPCGAKLHAGRSRNDQVAVDVRMWLREEIIDLRQEIALLQKSLLTLAENNTKVIIPGYTHLQRAQPVYFSHHILAYVEMLNRDNSRLRDCLDRVNYLPFRKWSNCRFHSSPRPGVCSKRTSFCR